MVWSIRNQILLPFCIVQACAIVAISISAAWLAVSRAEREAIEQLNRVTLTLSRAQFPVKDSVLLQMKGLSGAEFIAATELRRITASTLPLETAQRILESQSDSIRATDELNGLEPVYSDGTRWFVGGVRPQWSQEFRLLLVLVPERQWLAIRRDAIMPSLTAGTMALIATAVISWWIASRFAGRIQRMDAHVRTLAEGRFDVRLSQTGNDELTSLASSINRMASDLAALTEQIRISERTQLITQVAGGLAHQLRNSITGAKLAIQLHLRRSSASDRESLDVAVHQLSLMEQQIRGLLGLTREAGQPVRSASFQELLNHVGRLLQPRCQHGQVDLQISISSSSNSDSDRVADGDQIEAALMNLIQNAIEACGPRGQVRVEVSEAVDRIQVSVLDNGPGVPQNLAERIFDPFVTGKPEGIGLGLAQARGAAESSGGSLTFRRADGWTCFQMTVGKVPS